MVSNLLVLQICDFLEDGDGYYRLHEPSRQLARLPGVAVVDCHFYHHLLPELLRLAHVVILPFIHDWDFFPLIDQRRAAGQVTVFEANDYFFDVQPWSPISAQWQDRSIQEEYRHYMTVADGVQTSTSELARRWREFSPRVAVFMNQLTEVPPLTPPPARPLTIGWGGSPGHFADWFHIAPVLERWLLAHPDVRLAVMTNEFARPFVRLPAERYHFRPFGSLSEYVKFLPELDIGLAPLLPTDYNRGRSDVKFLEYASHGVAGVYANLEPYRETVVEGQTGVFYRTDEELLRCLDALAGDGDLRQRIRRQAHDYVTKNRRIEDHIGKRREFYQGLFRQPPAPAAIPEEVLTTAVRDGNYLQLRPGPVEKAFLQATRQADPRQAAQALIQLLNQLPRYVPALLHLGQTLNNLGDHRGALRYLDQAFALNPLSARALCEAGRAYFRLNDAARARERIEQGLAVNPYYHPGYQYLLRLLALTRAPDGPEWANRARQRFPTDYHLALAGARLYPHPEAVRRVGELLNEFSATFKPEEKSAAVVAFGETIQEITRGHVGEPEAVDVLRRCAEAFPQSARLANLLGRALFLAGKRDESNLHYQRALDIRRAFAIYRTEFPKEDGTIHYWQFAEHIDRWLEAPSPPVATGGL